MNILISDTLEPNLEIPNHPVLVRNAFLEAYPLFPVDQIFFFDEDSLSQDSYNEAIANNCSILIRSTLGMEDKISLALANYPDIITVMPAGSNDDPPVQVYDSGGNLPNIIVTGAGDAANETGYDIEFFSLDPIGIEPDLSSYSNGYIAGQLAYIANALDVNLWTARYLARQAGNEWTAQNGYGLINVAEAIAAYNPSTNYNALDPYIERIGTNPLLSLSKKGGLFNLAYSVLNASTYEIYRAINDDNYELLIETDQTSYEDTNDQSGSYKYKVRGKFTNAYGEEEISEYSSVIEIKQRIQSEVLLSDV